MTFADVYVFRLGAGITLPSACSGFAFGNQPPAVLSASPFGQGLSFRFVLTPQVWVIGGEVAVGFDGRDGDPSVTGVEVALAKAIGAGSVRFTITRPEPGAIGLDYARLAMVSAPVQGVNRLYQCVIGIPTLAAEVATSPSGTYRRTAVLATAYVRDGATSQVYSLAKSVAAISADMPARRVAIALRLVGTPMGGGTADVELGTFTASAPIDAEGNFVANLSGDRPVSGAISGRLFGPQGVEIGGAFGATVTDASNTPSLSFSGAVYGVR